MWWELINKCIFQVLQRFKIILAVINLFNLLFLPLGDFLFAFCYAALCMYNNGMHKEKRKRKRKRKVTPSRAPLQSYGQDIRSRYRPGRWSNYLSSEKNFPVSRADMRFPRLPLSSLVLPIRFANQLQVFWSLCFNRLFCPRPCNLPTYVGT